MTIKAFGYILKIQFFKKIHPEPNSGFSGHFHDKGIKLKVENGFFVVVDKYGEHIPVQTKLKLIDKVNEPCLVKVTFLCGGFYEEK
jgi:hypothetical protein